MIAAALISLFGIFHWNAVPEDRNIFESQTIPCCPMYNKKVCPKTIEDAYNVYKCINKREYEIAKEKNFAIFCEYDQFGGACLCGCFDPSTLIRVWDIQVHAWKDETLETIDKDIQRYLVLARAVDEDGNQISIDKVPFTIDHCAGKPLLVFQLSNGQVLKVTAEHPMWLGDGWNRADELDVGDFLIAVYGEDVEILSITSKPAAERVMNIRVIGEDKENLFLANGIWTGGAKEQENLHNEDGTDSAAGIHSQPTP